MTASDLDKDGQRSRFMTGAQTTALWISEAQVSKKRRDTETKTPMAKKTAEKRPMMRNI